ncbi:MAG: hypothetical protein M4579_007491, partial [Chaenotheca gracillima]
MALRRSTRVTPSKGPAEPLTRPVSVRTKPTTKNGPAQTNGVKKTPAAPSKRAAKKKKKATPAQSKEKEDVEFAKPALPTTPRRQRKAPTTNDDDDDAAPPPPFTPTPSAINLMTIPYSTGDIDDTDPPAPAPPPKSRPAATNRTNAPLISPATSRLVAYGQSVQDDGSPSKTGLPRPTTSTATLLEEACAHIVSVDPKLRPLVEKHHCRIFSPEGLEEEIDPFRSLASGIIAQQVSGAAASSIKNKFISLFNPPAPAPQIFPTPTLVAATPLPTLRTAGLSQRKAEYIQGLAERFRDGELSTDMLMRASDDEVLEKLVAVRGLGRWSVEMFACFGLKRMDVFSTGDLGVQYVPPFLGDPWIYKLVLGRGMAAYTGKNVANLKAKGGGKWKYMSEKDMLDLSARFSPY